MLHDRVGPSLSPTTPSQASLRLPPPPHHHLHTPTAGILVDVRRSCPAVGRRAVRSAVVSMEAKLEQSCKLCKPAYLETLNIDTEDSGEENHLEEVVDN